MSTETEPETRDIIMECLVRGTRVFIPKLDGDKMQATEIYAGAEYVKNEFGIVEIKFAHPVSVDCAFNIIPLVAFDERLNRVGHGKGYYDKYLVGKTGVNVGLAYECQKFEGFAADAYDIPLDIVVTETCIYTKQKTDKSD
jgi:5,10-methenyltetrahydrofolate synthetase